MEQETDAPLDDLEAVEDAEDDLGDGGYSQRCGGTATHTGNT